MAFPKMDEIRELSDQEIIDQIAASRRQLFDLRFQKGIRKLDSGTHQFKQIRHRLAQLMTLQRQRQLVAVMPTEGDAGSADTVAADS